MRTIEFRGKRIDNEQWVFGYLSANNSINVEIVDSTVGYSSIEEFEVIPETVSQYIGINDINGVKIFEGDIIEFSNADISSNPIEGIAKVIYNNDLTLSGSPGYALWFIKSKTNAVGFHKNMLGEIKVIGNMYYNNELWKNI